MLAAPEEPAREQQRFDIDFDLENEFETQKFVGGQRRGAAVFSAVAGAFGRSFFGQNARSRLVYWNHYVVVVIQPQGRHLLLLGLAVEFRAVLPRPIITRRTERNTRLSVRRRADQIFPDAALTTNGGTNGAFVVWQDNTTDGSGWGVSARRLDSTLSGTLAPSR